MNTFNNYSELLAANSTQNAATRNMATDNMSPEFKQVPHLGSYAFGAKSNEEVLGGKLEPPHVHVMHGNHDIGRFWLEDENTGEVSVDRHKTKGLADHEINKIIKHIQHHKAACFDEWDERIAKNNLQHMLSPKELEQFKKREALRPKKSETDEGDPGYETN